MPSSPPPSPRIPMQAPVSRAAPGASGGHSPTSITLTAEEREIARNSFSSDLTMEQRERLYAQNKAKLARMRADGSYPERERG